ncbi:MAG: site-2 protease family protein [Novosphingobium sp.]
MNETLYQAAAVILPLVFAIVFHEVAHGWMARALGDPTAHRMKRLTLNPIRHVDPIGTIVLPGFLKLVGAPVFGWAKPVPVNKRMLRNPRLGMMAVAAAGPGSNLILAAIAAVALGFLLQPYAGLREPSGVAGFVMLNLSNFIQINVFLALFNLLPLPPFDGSHIVEGLLPPSWAESYEKLRPLGFPVVLLLLIVLPSVIKGFDPVGAVVMPPVEWALGHYVALAQAVAGG